MNHKQGDPVTMRGCCKRLEILAVHELQGVYELSNGLMASDDTLSAYIERTRPIWRPMYTKAQPVMAKPRCV